MNKLEIVILIGQDLHPINAIFFIFDKLCSIKINGIQELVEKQSLQKVKHTKKVRNLNCIHINIKGMCITS